MGIRNRLQYVLESSSRRYEKFFRQGLRANATSPYAMGLSTNTLASGRSRRTLVLVQEAIRTASAGNAAPRWLLQLVQGQYPFWCPHRPRTEVVFRGPCRSIAIINRGFMGRSNIFVYLAGVFGKIPRWVLYWYLFAS
jgi:hypothetical protein